MFVRYFALVMGILFLLAAVGGFIPGITLAPDADMPSVALPASYGLLLGLFPINAVHNLVHLGLGIGGVVMWRNTVSARTYARALALILGAFTIMGLLPGLNTTFGALPLFGHDVWLHGLEALAGAYFGFVYPLGLPRTEVKHGRT